MTLCRHATDKAPVKVKFCLNHIQYSIHDVQMKETVKKALNEFKRTHHDSWHEHKLEFDEEQLETLTVCILYSLTLFIRIFCSPESHGFTQLLCLMK